MTHKFSFVIISLFLFLIALPTHAAWVQKEQGTIQGLQAITKAGDHFFAVGNTGNIIRSVDGGLTWSVYDNNASVYWQDVQTIGQTIRAIGESGTMRESLDGGVTWSPVALGVAENLYNMKISTDRGFIVGAGGRILIYNSNAKIWQAVTSPTTLALYGVHDMGDGKAWIVGAEGILLYSADSGVNWTNTGKIVNEDLLSVWFSSATTGYAVGKNGIFLKTINSGTNWTTVSVNGLTSQKLYDITGLGEEIIVAGDKILIRSTDGGITWTSTDYTTQNFTFRDAFISSATDAWAVGTKDDVQSVIVKWESDVVYTPVVEPPSTTAEPGTAGSGDINPSAGSLIKTVCTVNASVNDPCRAVYFYATDGKRHAFPNDKIFFTWFENFDSVKEVSASFLSLLTLGKNVTYHPGTKMVKFQSVPTVYAVSKKGTLRAIDSEQIAAQLYGSDWNKKIDDISDAFVGNYSFGTKIMQFSDYDVVREKSSVSGLNENF